MSDALRLFGTRVIVTAAGDGIGEAIVRTFVKQGAVVCAVDGPDSGVDTLFRSLKGVTPLAQSIRDEDSAADIVESAVKALDGLDVVVNNGSLQPKTPFGIDDGAQMDAFIERKVALYRAVTRAALPHLERSPAGRIVSVGCLRSAFAKDNSAGFSASERALAELTNRLAQEVGPDGVTANYIQPGAVMTPASRRVFNDNKALRDHCIQRSAAKRLGEPVDVGKVALFLASDDAVFVSGTGIVVDGGSA